MDAERNVLSLAFLAPRTVNGRANIKERVSFHVVLRVIAFLAIDVVRILWIVAAVVRPFVENVVLLQTTVSLMAPPKSKKWYSFDFLSILRVL